MISLKTSSFCLATKEWMNTVESIRVLIMQVSVQELTNPWVVGRE
jgi:hypothetical protein